MKKEFTCKRCKNLFTAYERKSHPKPPQYCSKGCASIDKQKRVRRICDNCKKDFYITKFQIKIRPAKFCSHQCAKQKQRDKLPVDKIIALYNQGKTIYEIGKIFDVHGATIQYRLKNNNVKRRSASERVKGENNPMYGKRHLPEAREKMRQANKRQFAEPEARKKHALLTIKQIQSKKTGKRANKLEKAVAALLNDLGIEYKAQFAVETFVFDFHLPKHNVLIECDGTFWHADPRRYPDRNKLSEVQKRNAANDKVKNKVASAAGFKLIRLWEKDVMETPDLVLQHLKNTLAP